MRRTAALTVLIAGILCAGLALAQGRRPAPSDDGVIHWPDPSFRTLQEAIDAAPEGGIVRIAEGVYQLTDGLVVREKTVTIEGAGCAIQHGGRGRPPRERRGGAVTHLAGPSPERVVEAERAIGAVNYISGGGGVLRGVKLTGFDAGVVSRDVERRAKPLAVQNTCVSDTGRGVLWLSPAALTMSQSLIQNSLKHGISLLGGSAHLYGIGVVSAFNSCMFFKSSWVLVEGATLFNCGGSFGIGVVNSIATVEDSTVEATSGPGIYFQKSAGNIARNVVGYNRLVGILVTEALAAVTVNGNEVFFNTGLNGFFGDGIDVILSPNASLTGNFSYSNARAGIANWGTVMLLQANAMSCNGFDLEGETHNGTPYQFINGHDNGCGCPTPVFLPPPGSSCVAVSASIAPPETIDDPGN